jgi:hypothetical protein
MSSTIVGPIEGEAVKVAVQRLALRDQLMKPLLAGGWRQLYASIGPRHLSCTLLDPSDTLQVSLRVPLETDTEEGPSDWDLWLEACDRVLSAPLRAWLEEQGESVSLSEKVPSDPLKINDMVLHLAGHGPLS